jgi:hypothetical protein
MSAVKGHGIHQLITLIANYSEDTKLNYDNVVWLLRQ